MPYPEYMSKHQKMYSMKYKIAFYEYQKYRATNKEDLDSVMVQESHYI